MPEDDKNNKEFEFIKEQIIPKKHKKFKKWLISFLMTIIMAAVFGVVAAVAFCIAEPGFYQFLHKDEGNKTPISFPTSYPENTDGNNTVTGNEGNTGSNTVPGTDAGAGAGAGTKVNSGTGSQAGNTGKADGQAETSDDTDKPRVITQRVDADLDDYVKMSDDIRKIAYDVNKSIVRISSIINGKDWFGNPVENKLNTTGLVVANDGENLFILVSLDRVKAASSIKLDLSDTVSAPAVLQDYDGDVNLAVLAVKIEDIPSLFMDNNITVANLGESYTVIVGSPVLALGNPNGYQNAMDLGIITSKGSSISITDNKLDLFNTNIADNKNSDGVIVNMNGAVIGIITRALKENLNEDLSTAIGISKIKPIIEDMINKKPLNYCGVLAEDMTTAAKNEYSVSNGIYVNEVKADSPAFDAGIRSGDIILQVDDKVIIDTNNFYNTISTYKPEDEITIQIKRTTGTADKLNDVKVVLAEKKNE